MVCTSLGSLLRPLFHFLCSILLIHRVLVKKHKHKMTFFSEIKVSVMILFEYLNSFFFRAHFLVIMVVLISCQEALRENISQVEGKEFGINPHSKALKLNFWFRRGKICPITLLYITLHYIPSSVPFFFPRAGLTIQCLASFNCLPYPSPLSGRGRRFRLKMSTAPTYSLPPWCLSGFHILSESAIRVRYSNAVDFGVVLW